MKAVFFPILLLVSFLGINAEAKNLHVLDSDSSGYKVVRTGKPDLAEFRELCQMGVKKLIVLSGNGSTEEKWAKTECPGFEVIYDRKQMTAVPLSKEFLNFFDEQVAQAHDQGYGLAFRCNCGCHHTGRLAAYFHMKYQGYTADQAVKDQRANAPGLNVLLHFEVLKHQIHALYDYVHGEACTEKAKYCVVEKDNSPEE